MTNTDTHSALRTELIATCELLRMDQFDMLDFVFTDPAFEHAFALNGCTADLEEFREALEDAYDPCGYGRCAIPADRVPRQLHDLHRAAHIARTRTFDPFFDLLDPLPVNALEELIQHARRCVAQFLLCGRSAQLPFPLTCRLGEVTRGNAAAAA